MKPKAFAFYRTGFYLLLALSGSLVATLLRSDRTKPIEIRELQTASSETATLPNKTRSEDLPFANSAKPSKAANSISVEQKLEALAQLTENHGVRVDFNALVNRQNQVREHFVELFDLSASQTDALNHLLSRTHDSLLAERAKHASATIEVDGSVSIELEPFIEPGRAMMDSFYGELESILGSQKLNVLERIAGEQFNHHFNQFGAEIANYKLQAKFNDDGNKYYHYTRYVELEHGHASNSSSFASFETEGASIAELNALLSPDIKRHLETLAE